MEKREPKNRRAKNQEARTGEPKNRKTEEPRTTPEEESIEHEEQSQTSYLQRATGNGQRTADNGQLTTDKPEQIGELIYLPNADYPYPFPVEYPPHYWMTEQTGRLAEAVETYVSGERLAPESLDLIRQYMRQYLERAVMTGDANRKLLIDKLATLRSGREIERFTDELAEIGVEPF